MGKSRFIIVGSGWRAMYYVRIAKALPELFELSAVLCRTEEKALKIASEYEIHTTTSIEECMNYHPDFVVVAVTKTSIYQVTKEWLNRGYPVLCETPASLELSELQDLWELHRNGAKLQVAEQYSKYPTYASQLKLLSQNILAEPYNVTISQIHDYHAVSIIRKILNVKPDVTIFGKKYVYPVTETLTRYEKLFDGRIADKERVRLTFEFDNGKVAYYDFSSIQYRSTIRTNYFNVQGPRGEMVNSTFQYLDEENLPHKESISIQSYKSGQIKSISFLDKIIYKCPYDDRGLTEDEIAISTFMMGMKNYNLTGEPIYPLEDALTDAYFTILMNQALENPNHDVKSEKQPWMID